MKMVKSLLLGSAAGLVAVTAGQAADLPVKAKPVEYVKICSLYGAGFYYMPGTDLCLKIGGWVRAEATYGGNGSLTWGPYNADANQRGTSNTTFRARGYITADAREQTAYGTARGYIAVGLSTNDTGTQAVTLVDSVNRAFVQWAGVTAGLSQSFYDFYSAAASLYRAGYIPSSDTGDGGWWVWGYTAQFGGGFSATVSMEARRMTQIIDANCAAPGGPNPSACGSIVPGSYPAGLTFTSPTAVGGANVAGVGVGAAGGVAPGAGAYGGQQVGDIVANLRVDQAWGAAQVMGAAHEVNASYYGNAPTATAPIPAPSITSGIHPGDKWGFVGGAGLKILFPSVAPGDYFQAQGNYTEGALRYINNGQNTNFGALGGLTPAGSNAASEVFGVMSDCVYGGSLAGANTTSCQLTTGWGVNAAYEHYWTPQWHQSLAGGYMAVRYNAAANAMLCSAAGNGNGTAAGAGSVAAVGCNNNWNFWGVGSRLQWDVTKSFYIGVEALYNNIDSATTSDGLTHGYSFGSSTVTENHQSNWSFTARMHKDFLP